MNKKSFSSVIGGLALLAISFGANALVIKNDVFINGSSNLNGNTLSFTSQSISAGNVDDKDLTSGWNASVSSVTIPLALNSSLPDLWVVTQGADSYKFTLDSVGEFSDVLKMGGLLREISFSGLGTLTNQVTGSAAALFGLTAQFTKQSDGSWAGSSSSLTVQAVPLPAAAWLFGSALLGLVGVARRRQSSPV